MATCVEAGSDLLAWVAQNPGRIRSMHCKEWAPQEGVAYKALIGYEVFPWLALEADYLDLGSHELLTDSLGGDPPAPAQILLERKVRGFNPWPGTSFDAPKDGGVERIKVLAAALTLAGGPPGSASPWS